MHVSVLVRLIVYMVIAGACWVPAAMSGTADNTGLETTVRALVRANSEKDLPTMTKLMSHDADITSYSIGGRKTLQGHTRQSRQRPLCPAWWTIRHHEVRRPSLARHLATARQRSRRRI